jgi:hypothetical protein
MWLRLRKDPSSASWSGSLLSTLALGTAERMLFLRQSDLVLLALTLPLFLAAGLPMLGWGTAAVAWLAQRGINELATRQVRGAVDPRKLVGVLAASMIGRGWLMAGLIFAVGVNHNSAGLAAAVLVIALVTVHFMLNMIMRPFDTPAAKTREAPRYPEGTQ